MKLELKHLVPYLPYDLKLRKGLYDLTNPILIGIDGNRIIQSEYIYHDASDKALTFTRPSLKVNVSIVKPILRPLSDLNKEIQMAEHYMTYKEHLQRMFPTESIHTNIATWSYRVVDWLFKWHFDVFGLIENRLAIDINTLTND